MNKRPPVGIEPTHTRGRVQRSTAELWRRDTHTYPWTMNVDELTEASFLKKHQHFCCFSLIVQNEKSSCKKNRTSASGLNWAILKTGILPLDHTESVITHTRYMYDDISCLVFFGHRIGMFEKDVNKNCLSHRGYLEPTRLRCYICTSYMYGHIGWLVICWQWIWWNIEIKSNEKTTKCVRWGQRVHAGPLYQKFACPSLQIYSVDRIH